MPSNSLLRSFGGLHGFSTGSILLHIEDKPDFRMKVVYPPSKKKMLTGCGLHHALPEEISSGIIPA